MYKTFAINESPIDDISGIPLQKSWHYSNYFEHRDVDHQNTSKNKCLMVS